VALTAASISATTEADVEIASVDLLDVDRIAPDRR
jgi:hypothetical protein